MNDKTIDGGAAPALAAHSKDAAAAGTNPASSATAKEHPRTDSAGSSTGSSTADAVSRLSGQARDAASRFVSSESVDQAREYIVEQGSRVGRQASGLVQQQPVATLLATAALGMILGLLLARR